jgi:hypothetical protein
LDPNYQNAVEHENSKFASDKTLLQYGSLKDCVSHGDSITSDPTLSMAQEWCRNDSWVDWRGDAFSAWEQWEYVRNPVPSLGEGKNMPSGGFGNRDKGNGGKTAADFLAGANEYIKKQVGVMRLV